MVKSVTAQIDEQIAMVEGRMEALYLGCGQDLVDEITKPVGNEGKLPFDLGFLRASFQMSTASMPQIDPEANNKEGQSFPQAETSFAILGSDPAETAYMGFTAAYAARMEFGFVGEDSLGRTYNQPGFGFVEGARLEWPRIVKENTAKAIAAFPDP